jgi:hypothetical protein
VVNSNTRNTVENIMFPSHLKTETDPVSKPLFVLVTYNSDILYFLVFRISDDGRSLKIQRF